MHHHTGTAGWSLILVQITWWTEEQFLVFCFLIMSVGQWLDVVVLLPQGRCTTVQVGKGGPQNAFSEKVGHLAQPTAPPPPFP